MRRKDVLKILKGLANRKPSEEFYFSLMKRTIQIKILKEQLPKYRKNTVLLNLLNKFSKRFLELIEEFGWNQRFEYILEFFEEMAMEGLLKKRILNQIKNTIRYQRDILGVAYQSFGCSY